MSKSKMFKVVHVEENGGMDALEFYDFPPGCIVAVSVCLNDVQSEALSRVRGTLLHQVCQFLSLTLRTQELVLFCSKCLPVKTLSCALCMHLISTGRS